MSQNEPPNWARLLPLHPLQRSDLQYAPLYPLFLSFRLIRAGLTKNNDIKHEVAIKNVASWLGAVGLAECFC